MTDRFAWAIGAAGIRGGERVLEVGGGPGDSAQRMLDLGVAQLVCVDRSAAAVAGIRRRCGDDERLVIVQSAIAAADPPPVDRVLALRVNVFWTTDASAELAVRRRALVPGGELHLCWDGPPDPRLDVVPERLRDAGFADARLAHDGTGTHVSATR